MRIKVICPIHGIKMNKMKIAYGLPNPDAVRQGAFKNEILGGCLADEYGKYGYECPTDNACYYFNEDRELKKMFSDNVD